MKTNEALTKARHSAGFLVGELREAHTGSRGALGILLLDMIGTAAQLEEKFKKRMRIPGLILALAVGIAACDGSGDDDFVDTDPVVVLSQHLVPAPFDGCDVVGQILNTDGDVHCDASVQVNAFGRSGTIIDQGFDNFSNIPPNTKVDYRAILTVPCGAIVRIETSVPTQICFD
jgi:hypothetical protein